MKAWPEGVLCTKTGRREGVEDGGEACRRKKKREGEAKDKAGARCCVTSGAMAKVLFQASVHQPASLTKCNSQPHVLPLVSTDVAL